MVNQFSTLECQSSFAFIGAHKAQIFSCACSKRKRPVYIAYIVWLQCISYSLQFELYNVQCKVRAGFRSLMFTLLECRVCPYQDTPSGLLLRQSVGQKIIEKGLASSLYLPHSPMSWSPGDARTLISLHTFYSIFVLNVNTCLFSSKTVLFNHG